MKSKDREYMSAVAGFGCVVCHNLGQPGVPATIHHIRAGQGMSQRAGHYLILPLCPDHHLHGGVGVAIHAGQRSFESIYGTELQLLDQVIMEVFHGRR